MLVTLWAFSFPWWAAEVCPLLYWCLPVSITTYRLGKCGHGLTSRPRESASELFLNELLSLFRYPPKSGRALLNGTLPLRYYAARFAYSTLVRFVA